MKLAALIGSLVLAIGPGAWSTPAAEARDHCSSAGEAASPDRAEERDLQQETVTGREEIYAFIGVLSAHMDWPDVLVPEMIVVLRSSTGARATLITGASSCASVPINSEVADLALAAALPADVIHRP